MRKNLFLIICCLAIVQSSSLNSEEPQKEQKPQLHTLKIKKAEIQDVLQAYTASGMNIIAGDIKGIVTVNCENVPLEESFRIVLGMVGYTYEKVGNIYKVVPLVKSINKGKVRQILIEAKIVQMGLNDENTIGLSFQRSDTRTEGTVTGTLLASNKFTTLTDGLSVNYTLLDAADYFLLLQMLDQKTTANILSSPRIVAVDGEEANMTSGQKIPITTTTRDLSGVISTATQWIDVGVNLTVTPAIIDDETIAVKIKPEVSSLTGQNIQQLPIIATRYIQTQVLVTSGKTLVIGGLIEDETQTTYAGIPFLVDLPLVGFLFGKQTKKQVKSDIIIFITPTIVQ